MAGPERRVSTGRVPRVWGAVPPRNRNFTGREELLATLREGITGQVTAVVPQPHALHGLGGVGKTQMAVEYCYRYQHSYDVVWWVPSDQPVLLKSTLAELAPYLDLPPASVNGIEDTVRDVLDALRRGEPYDRWLLVFDNADQPEDLFDLIPPEPGHVLITSRNHRWAGRVDTVQVDVFRREESIEFLRKRARNAITDPEADRLAQEVGDLPLALEQAGALLFETGMAATEYLEQLTQRTSQLLSQGRPAEYPLPMTAAWSISVSNLSETLPEAIGLLQVCAFFGSEPIPRDAFGHAPDGVGPELSGLLADPIRLGRAVGELGRYALAKLDVQKRTIQIHRLVQMLLQDELSADDQVRLRHEAHLLLATYDAGDPDDVAAWPKYANLLGHLGPAQVVECRHPVVRDFAIRMLRYLFGSGDYEAASTVAEGFIDRWTADSGPEDPHVIEAKLELGNILREKGDYRGSHAINLQALDLAEKVLGPDHSVRLRALRGSAADLRALGDFEEAKRRDEESLRLYEELTGPDSPGALRAVSNLGLDYVLLSQYEHAIELHHRAFVGWLRPGMEISQASLLSAQGALARALRLAGHYSDACDQNEDAYARGLETLGAEHNWTLRTGKDLAVAYRMAGDFEQAEELARQIHDRCVRLFGLDAPDTLAAAVCLSNTLRHRGEDLDAATDLARDTAARYARVLQPDHPFTLAARGNYAILLRVQGDLVGARKLNDEVHGALAGRLGSDHDYTLAVAANLASDLAALGEIDAAVRLGQDTLRRFRALLGPSHPTTLGAAANLSVDLKAAGQTEAAEELAKETAEAYQRTLGPAHPDVVVFKEGRHLDLDFDPSII